MSNFKLRTRQYTDLTAWEIEEYLKSNDIIIVPVGHCETLGATPVDGEYVGAAGWANLIAEAVDGIVLPHVTFTCTGGTYNGRGTVYMSLQDSLNHVLALMHSLYHQGFKRQVYIPAHGPTQMFLCAAVNAFYDETKHTLLYLDPNCLMAHCGITKKHDFTFMGKPDPIYTKSGKEVLPGDTMLANYKICGRLDAVPAKGEVDFPEAKLTERKDTLAPWYKGSMERLFWCCDFCTPAPIIFQNAAQHGGVPVARWTREEMEVRAAVGEEYLRELVEATNYPDLLEGLKQLQTIQAETVKAQADHLPPNKYAPVNVWYK